MTVRELIEILQKVDNQDKFVFIHNEEKNITWYARWCDDYDDTFVIT